ncbi:MAG: serine/threonine-protein kinase, partial [Nocardioidaceae bacterium]
MDPELIADRYRVVRPIGRGGMGTVWLCEDGVLNRRVAVKRIGGLPGDDIDQAARAMREARVTAALNHDHAVSVFDVVDDGGATWLVMEYVPSRTLAELIKTEGPLTPRRAATIGGQVADALATAHGLAILHRDVKPGNILVSEGDRAKISDFGIARGHTDLTLTQTGMMIGTPTYFAPELARGEHPSFASDVWALGATLYSAVEGKPPFPAQETPLATLGLIARESAPRAERAGPLADVIAAMLAPEPTQRWSMERVRNALDEVAQSDTMPVESPVRVEATAPDPTPTASASPPPPRPAPTASPDVARDPRTGTSGRASRAVRWGIVAAVALIVLGAAGLATWAALSNG